MSQSVHCVGSGIKYFVIRMHIKCNTCQRRIYRRNLFCYTFCCIRTRIRIIISSVLSLLNSCSFENTRFTNFTDLYSKKCKIILNWCINKSHTCKWHALLAWTSVKYTVQIFIYFFIYLYFVWLNILKEVFSKLTFSRSAGKKE